MALGPDYRTRTVSRTGVAATEIDLGLRQYMLRVYNYMLGGLALTGLVAYAVVSNAAIAEIVFPLRWVALIATFGIVLFMSFRLHAMQATTAQILFWVYAALMGVWLSPIVLIYTGASVAKTFFVTAGMFGAMSLYGYTTKRDLTSIGSFLVMGLFGLIIAMVVNIFMQSAAMDFAISVLGVVIFTGLTAWDTQKIKEWYAEFDEGGVMTKKAVMGALSLYLDFLNMFLFLLRLLGAARSN